MAETETEYVSRFTPRWIIESAYYVDGHVTFRAAGRQVERAKVAELTENGFGYLAADGTSGRLSWDEVGAARYFQPIRRIGEIRGPGDVTWVEDEKLWPCEHCASGDHVPCPAPHGGLGLCCCDDAPSQMTLEYVDALREIGLETGSSIFQDERSTAMLELARSRGWTRRY